MKQSPTLGGVRLGGYYMKFSFEAFNNTSKCEIDIFGKVVIATQLANDDMPGTSITNGAEIISKAVCDEHNIKYSELIWIEHYREDCIDEGFYKIVKFDIENGVFSNPNWKEISLETLADIIKNKYGYEYTDTFIVESRKKLEINYKTRKAMIQAICQHTHTNKNEDCWACGKFIE